jgi:transcription elongation factor GreB
VNKISYKKPDWFEEQPIVENTLTRSDDTLDDIEDMSEEELKKIEEEYLKTMVK